jgi:hypothetical protein
MKLLDEYFRIQEEIFAHFGYKEGWRSYPVEDRRDMYWIIDHGVQVTFAESKDKLPLDEQSEREGNYYCDEIIHEKIYEKEDFTAILVDTQCDGNKFFAIFDNSKKIA